MPQKRTGINDQELVKISDEWNMLLDRHYIAQGRDEDKAQGNNYQTNTRTYKW